MASTPLALAPDGTGFALGHDGPMLAGARAPGEGDAILGPSGNGTPWVALLAGEELENPPAGASLYVVDPRAVPASELRASLARLRARIPDAMIAAELQHDDALRPSPVDAGVVRVSPDAESTARATLAAGIQAAGRPVLALVDSDVPADSVTAAIDAGAAGAVFATDRGEKDAAAIAAVRAAERERLADAPLITVAICNRNGARDLGRCLASLDRVTYPNFETLVIDDGSTDDSVAVARRFGARVVELPPSGLGVARNAAIDAARGEVLAFLDGDAEAEPPWLTRLWRLHDRLRPGGVGGPNLGMQDANWQERAVGGAPGVAMPIVRADGTATHLAGCNMSFRTDVARAALFDPDAPSGDDIRFCYRVQDLGEDLLLAPTAIVRHRRRRSIEGYLRQMAVYGRWSTVMQVEHGNRLVDVDVNPGLLARLDPRRPHRCFVGPQAAQRYSLAYAPLSNGFPLKAMALTVALALALAAPARGLGRLRAWLYACALAAASQAGYVIARTPVQEGPGGLAGARNRLLTAALWYAGPGAVASGRLRGLRQASSPEGE